MSAGLSVVLPAFNEAGHIAANVERLIACLAGSGRAFEVIVVDDGSTDGTGDAARSVRDDRVRVHAHDRNRGKGRALATGCAAAREDIVVLLDADLEIPPEDVVPLVERLEESGADVAVGSKYHEHASLDWPLGRRLLSRVYQFVTTLCFRLPLRDTQTGLKALRRSVADEIVPRLRARRFAWDLELVLLAHRAGHPCVTGPVRVTPADRASRVGWAGALQAGFDTLRIFARDRGLAAYGPVPAPRVERPTRVIVSGDDLGLSPSVNEGLLSGLERGGLTSVSVLTTGARVEEGITQMHARCTDADAGLHLDLLRGRTPWQHAVAPGTAGEALATQLADLKRRGIEATHVDAHRHAWCLPWDYRALCRRMRATGIRAVRALRPLGSPAAAGAVELGKRLVLLACAVLSAGVARGFGLAVPDGWVDAREAARWPATGVPRWARGKTIEVIAHPVVGAPDVPSDEQGTLDRQAETRAVFEPPLAEALAAVGVEITTFRELAAARRR